MFRGVLSLYPWVPGADGPRRLREFIRDVLFEEKDHGRVDNIV